MAEPILFVVDADPAVLASLAAVLERRFGADYRILTDASPASALARIEQACGRGEKVALLVADLWTSETGGPEWFVRLRELCPGAGRCVLVRFGDAPAYYDLRRVLAPRSSRDVFPQTLGPSRGATLSRRQRDACRLGKDSPAAAGDPSHRGRALVAALYRAPGSGSAQLHRLRVPGPRFRRGPAAVAGDGTHGPLASGDLPRPGAQRSDERRDRRDARRARGARGRPLRSRHRRGGTRRSRRRRL